MKLRFSRTPYRATALCAVALLQALAAPVFAQSAPSEFAAALRGTRAPQTIKASELTPEWRRFAATSPQMDLRALVTQSTLGAVLPYYSRGETVAVGNETYLIAYRQSTPRAEPKRSSYGEDEEPATPDPDTVNDEKLRLRPNDVLTLSLLNLHTLGDLNHIRAFDPARDIFDEAAAAAAAVQNAPEASASNLKQIGLGIMQYVQDYDEKFPPMRSVQSRDEIEAPPGPLTAVQQAVQPYVKSVEIFSHPLTHEIYQPNIALSGVNDSSLTNSSETVLFWEKSPDPNGTRAVLYADGHVKREPEANWPAILAKSNKLVPPRIWKRIEKTPPPRPAPARAEPQPF